MKSNPIILKLLNDSTLKRVRKLPKTMAQLETVVYSEFPTLLNNVISIKYTDAEGDEITVNTDNDLVEAYHHLKERKGTSLRLVVTKEGQKEPELKLSMVDHQKPIEALENSFEDCIKFLTAEELANCGDKIKNMAMEEAAKNPVFTEEKVIVNTVHKGVRCNGCKVSPIQGIRYKCSHCPKYNLCQKCEEKEIHRYHTFLKLVAEEPVSKAGKKTSDNAEEEEKKVEKLAEKKRLKRETVLKEKEEAAKQNRQMAKLVGEETIIISGAPGAIVMVPLKYENLSEKPWPIDSCVEKANGNILFEPIFVPQEVKAGDSVSLYVPVQLPLKNGHYKLRLRLRGRGKSFGQAIFIAAKVQGQIEEGIQKPKAETTIQGDITGTPEST